MLLLGILWVILFWYLRNPVFRLSGGLETLGVSGQIGGIEVDKARLEGHVKFLSGLQPARSPANAESMKKAERYVQSQFQEMGMTLRLQDVPSEGHVYHNIIARLGPKKTEDLVVVGAHLDVAGDLPGADDNASGVAGLIELARLFTTYTDRLERPIEFVAYALEEPPYFGTRAMGSAVHADALKAQAAEVKLMISLEMIGYFTDASMSQRFPSAILYGFYPWRGNFIAAVGSPAGREAIAAFKTAFQKFTALPLYTINVPSFVPGVDFSDHRNYWTHGWPALMVTDTAFYRNDEYHKAGDTADRLDFAKMADVVRGTFGAVLAAAGKK